MADPTRGEIEAAVHLLPLVVQAPGLTEWERQFCASVIRRDRGGRFAPTPKQWAVLRRLVDTWRAENMRAADDHGSVIEDQ